MRKQKNESPVSKESFIFRCGNGIKLIKAAEASHLPQSAHYYNTGYTVEQVMDLPFNFYFLNLDGVTLHMNEPCVEICGFQSVKDSIGKSLFDVSNQECARDLIDNCNIVIAEDRIKIFEEKNLRNDGVTLGFLSIKSPWYDQSDKVMGTFGCSIVLGQHSLSESLIKISELGLLTTAGFTFKNTVVSQVQEDRSSLSKRENMCLYHLCKGFTLKEIAKRLEVSPKTVETYLERAKHKLHCSNKAELIAVYLHSIKSS